MFVMCLQRGLSVRVIYVKGSTSAPYPLYANIRSLSYPFEGPPNPPKIKPTVDPFLPLSEDLLLSQLFFPLSSHRSYPSFEAIRIRYEEPQ